MRIHISDQIYIHRKYVTKKLLDWIKRELQVENPAYNNNKRYGYGNVDDIEPYLYLYAIRGTKLILPRGFFFKLVKYCKDKKIELKVVNKTIQEGHKVKLPKVSLYDYQNEAVEKLYRRKQGIIVMPCGSGKTRTAIALIRKTRVNSLVIVNSNFLIDQWTQYIKELFDYDVGIIQGDKFEMKPITIATVQTLNNIELDNKFLNYWGLVCVDEVHHIPAETYQSTVSKFPAQYRYGTTATVKRTDGLTKMVYYTVGSAGYVKTAKELEEAGYLIMPEIHTIQTNLSTNARKFNKAVDALIRDEERNRNIVTRLRDNASRFNLVLSSRIEHLETLARMYSEHNDDYRVVTSKVKKNERKEIVEQMKNGQLHVIFATQLADEGLDIPNLDTLHLVHPTKSEGRIEQRIGRTQRMSRNKGRPIVYDYVDTFVPMFLRMFNIRVRLYRRLELNISTQSVPRIIRRQRRVEPIREHEQFQMPLFV